MIKFPYGISDFYKLITEDYFYVDRTAHIPLLEEIGSNLLFLRPRRFGKSLLTSMLENYYDVNKADEFEKLFGHLAIGKKPTPLHNQYLVMRWDFSMVKARGTVEELEQRLYNHINTRLATFVEDYEAILGSEVSLHPNDAITSFEATLGVVRRTPYKMYLLIDEYDNFANAILMGGDIRSRERYETLVQGEGVLKSIFQAVKGATTGLGLDRVFITGVSPVVMSDITTAHNISKQISFEPAFGDLCGFWEREIKIPLQQVVSDCGLPEESVNEALTNMQTFYNGYAFYEEGKFIYNPTLVLYFLDHYQRRCQGPLNMLDGNFAMDRAKIAYVAGLPNGESLVINALEKGETVTGFTLEDRFGIADMLAPSQDKRFMASLLTYLGVLTLGGRNRQGKLILKIPNLVVRKLYAEYLMKHFLPGPERDAAWQAADSLYSHGDLQPLCHFIETRYFKVFERFLVPASRSSVRKNDYRDANELTIKAIFLSVLFNDTAYIMDSEKPLQRGYADLTMIVRPQMRQYQLLDLLIEFKYVKPCAEERSISEAGVTGEQARTMSPQQVAELAEVKKKLGEAKSQVKKYRQGLEKKYRHIASWRTYVVVALGFERLVWEEVQKEGSEAVS
ncbi:MAG: AAA family ATPase [Ardenticatenaceae bacterium]